MQMTTLKKIRCGGFCTLLLLVAAGPVSAVEPPDETPFRESAQAFVDAYVARDVNAIGNLFTEDAEFFDEFGGRTEGRDAIVQMYADTFATSPEVSIDEIQLERLRQITDKVVMEEGVVVVTPATDQAPYQSRYVALHTLEEDGKWRINSLKDFPPEPLSRQDQLAELSWMLGDWVNEDGESVVHTSCNWSEDGNFLLKSFTLQTYDGREMSGEQRIGWDASRKRIRSWTFDSEGGHLSGLWTRDGNNWIVNVVGSTADGRTVSGLAVYTVIDSEMIEWQYRNLVVGDEIRGANDPIRMVRRPPTPAES
jgi:uncharacterized protein (TIGR02246 family)